MTGSFGRRGTGFLCWSRERLLLDGIHRTEVADHPPRAVLLLRPHGDVVPGARLLRAFGVGPRARVVAAGVAHLPLWQDFRLVGPPLEVEILELEHSGVRLANPVLAHRRPIQLA